MNVSTGLPRAKGIAAVTHIISARAEPVTITRPTKSTNEFDEITETTAEHTELMWLFEPDEGVSEEITGERINGGIGGLVVNDGGVDIQTGDTTTYGGVTYEAESIVGHPSDTEPDGTAQSDTDFWMVRFTRRQ
jgi:hypothetical protein